MTVPLKSAKEIVIIRRNGLGDLLCAMPLISYCREQAPEANITIVADPRNASLLPYLRGFDKVDLFPKGNKYLGAVKMGMKYWRPRVDIAIATKTLPTRLMCFTCWAMRARHRVAVVGDEWWRRFVNNPVALSTIPEGSIHQGLAILKLVAPELNDIPEAHYPKLVLNEQFTNGLVATTKQKLSVGEPTSPWLFVSMTNNRVASTLGVEGHASILNTVAERCSFRTVVSCEPKDQAKATELQKLLKTPTVVIPTHSIDELIALLSLVDNVFVGDGGVMHLAAALDKPQTVLFGRDIITQWHPLSKKAACFTNGGHVQRIPQATIVDSLCKQLSITSSFT